MTSGDHFRHCSTCKAPIEYGSRYYKCSVSTCNRKATALYFCSVPCWDAHVPDARHRDAWAEVENAPQKPVLTEVEQNLGAAPLRRKIVPASTGTSAPLRAQDAPHKDLPRDTLIVMSKLKAFLKAYSDMKTSDGVSGPLSDHLRDICVRAISSAQANERKTVLARDIEAALRDENANE